jgi:LysM repeat protein
MRQVFVLQSFAMASCLLLALLVWARGPVINSGVTLEPTTNVDLGNQKKVIKTKVDKSQPDPESLKDVVTYVAQREVVQSNSTSSIYIVKSGDTLGHIAQRFKVTVAELKAMNKLQSDVITVGRELTVSQGQ